MLGNTLILSYTSMWECVLHNIFIIRYCAKKFLKLREGSRTVRESLFAHNVVTNFKLHAWMGCIIIYYVTRTQIANLLHKLPVCESVCEPVHEPFYYPQVSPWIIHFMLREPMHLHTYLHASVAKRIGHELTREVWIDSWTGSWPGSWTSESRNDFIIYALNCILQS